MSRPSDVIHAFIGYDTRQTVLFNVVQHCIIRHCSKPVSITPIKLSDSRGLIGSAGACGQWQHGNTVSQLRGGALQLLLIT